MTNDAIEKAIDAVFILDPIDCTKEEWPAVREAVKTRAQQWADRTHGDRRAEYAFDEIRRLDGKFSK
jgi:hypothetical protein